MRLLTDERLATGELSGITAVMPAKAGIQYAAAFRFYH